MQWFLLLRLQDGRSKRHPPLVHDQLQIISILGDHVVDYQPFGARFHEDSIDSSQEGILPLQLMQGHSQIDVLKLKRSLPVGNGACHRWSSRWHGLEIEAELQCRQFRDFVRRRPVT